LHLRHAEGRREVAREHRQGMSVKFDIGMLHSFQVDAV
jgi:hypothetical protein